MKGLNKLLLVLPAMVIATIANMFICSIVSQTILQQLVTYGVEKHISLIIAIIIAIVTYGFILYNYKIWEFIKKENKK